MITTVYKEDAKSEALGIDTIYLVGPWRVHNELLASFLEEKMGAKCLIVKTIRHLPVIDN
jgi:hypothetical protein